MTIGREEAERFTFTGQRQAYITTMAAFAVLILLEAGLIGVAAGMAVKTPATRAALISVLLATILYASGKMVAPFLVRHMVQNDTLHLRYSLFFKAAIPLSSIASAQPAKNPLDILDSTGAKYDSEKRRMVIVFSDAGQVLLRLNRTMLLHTSLLGGGPTDEILLNVDDRDRFLALFGEAPAVATAQPNPPLAVAAAGRSPEKPANDETSLYRTSRAVSASELPPALAARALTRYYGEKPAVQGLDLTVHPGEIYGFLGANGAGKTSLIKMVVGLLRPSAGVAEICGHDVWDDPLHAKAFMGYVADYSMLYERLTGREFLRFIGQMRCMDRKAAEEKLESLIGILDFGDVADEQSLVYSFGTKRKLSLAAALMHEPPVLILDEPFNGLDPVSAYTIKELFTTLSTRGTAIFLSTHDLATAENICHRAAIIDRGRLVAEGSIAELRESKGAINLETTFLRLAADREAP